MISHLHKLSTKVPLCSKGFRRFGSIKKSLGTEPVFGAVCAHRVVCTAELHPNAGQLNPVIQSCNHSSIQSSNLSDPKSSSNPPITKFSNHPILQPIIQYCCTPIMNSSKSSNHPIPQESNPPIIKSSNHPVFSPRLHLQRRWKRHVCLPLPRITLA